MYDAMGVLTFIIAERCEVAQDIVIKVQKPAPHVTARGLAGPLCLWNSSGKTVYHPQGLLRIPVRQGNCPGSGEGRNCIKIDRAT